MHGHTRIDMRPTLVALHGARAGSNKHSLETQAHFISLRVLHYIKIRFLFAYKLQGCIKCLNKDTRTDARPGSKALASQQLPVIKSNAQYYLGQNPASFLIVWTRLKRSRRILSSIIFMGSISQSLMTTAGTGLSTSS